jgi:uncharacterized protein (TIGR02147 family)
MEAIQPTTPRAQALNSAELLKQAFQEKLKKNPAYSLRAASRDLGVTHGYLSLVLNGKKRLTFKRAVQFAQFLHMDEERTELFLKAVSIESMKDPQCRSFLQSSMTQTSSGQANEFAMLEIDRFRVLSEWYHIAILDLTLVTQFKADPTWVAIELGISTDQVKTAVARLERLGLLEISNGRWIKTSAKLAVPTTYSDRAVREFHGQMINKALEALQLTSPEDFAAREISGVTFTVDPERLPEAKKRVEKFKREMMEFMGDGHCTALYQMNVQLFNLNKTGTKQNPIKKGNRK